ncbi:kappaPI-actitoxin-Avd3d-like [Cylas formicarius]|uniref:kappaPI-actitoxin-Avd3d-like n=1 Tax=Cylas formicarius TaxID=197179 RepID=UPI0029586ECE|nr:kappaPI-actitoxin-Avd3d-like [Cylas formicarius]
MAMPTRRKPQEPNSCRNVFSCHQIFLAFAIDDCDKPHTTSTYNCYALLIRYHWNNTTNECEEVIYGGCGGSANNFNSLEECELTAKPICSNQ